MTVVFYYCDSYLINTYNFKNHTDFYYAYLNINKAKYLDTKGVLYILLYIILYMLQIILNGFVENSLYSDKN